MNRFNLFLLSGTVMMLYSCAAPRNYSEIKQLDWLNGTWENQTRRGSIFESWKTVNDSTLGGRSYSIRNEKDTVVMETIELRKRNGGLYYVPTVAGQNAGQPVPFKMTLLNKEQLVFENPAHDFPQKISYTRIGKDSLLAEISGTVKGQLRSQKFPMRKVK